MTSMFAGQHLSVAETTDTGMGSMEVWVYYVESAGTVCLGGNNAPGIGSNYLVAVGPAVVHTEMVGSVGAYEYIGCFIDSSSRDIAVGMGGLSGDPADRVMECAQRCTGYAYMGLQWDNECFCDNDYGGQGERDITSCDSDGEVGGFPDYADLAGVGNPARAGWTNAVYELVYIQDASGTTGLGSVSNVVTHSTRCDDGAGYAPSYFRTGNPYYCDRDYVMTDIPDFLQGAVVIMTDIPDKRSDPNDTEWICCDLDIQSTVYVLYDSRVEDGAEPAWLQASFGDQHEAVAGATDGDMGNFEIWYGNVDEGTVCTGGNNAPGIGSHYILVVGAFTDHGSFNPLIMMPAAIEGYSYVGCFVDSGNRDIAVASGVGLDAALFSDARVMQCANACDGYAYMGLQWVNECFCDNDYGGQGEADIADCDTTSDVSDDAGAGDTGIADRCAVNGEGDCGWRNAVYEITYGAPGTGTPLVSNLVTASTEACAAAAEPVELTEGSTLYCDRDYTFTALPPFLQGTILIPTANNDKRSDPEDAEFLCFDLADEATVYLLYDSRAEDGSEPSWMTSMFAGQHLSVAETTDTGMGSMEVWVYYAEEAQTVCLGGNNAPGIGSNYLVAVGRAQVHAEIVGAVSGYNYIGCFIDSSPRDIEVGMGGLDGSPADRVMECANRCTGYAYMGLQWDNECFCDNNYGDQGERDISSCDSDGEVGGFPDFADLAGVGNPARAGWTNAVYDILYLQADGSSATGR